MNRIAIRPLARNNGKAFLSLVDALADYERLKRPNRAAKLRLLRDATGKRKRVSAFLAFVGREPVGYAILFETYSSFRALPTLYLEDLFVLPEWRRHKIGLALFRKCLAEAKRRRCGRMEWMVLGWNKPAIRFYEKLNSRWMEEWQLYRIDLS